MAWLRRTADRAAAGPTTSDFVDELVQDATLVARYGRYAGTFRDDEFFKVLGRVSELGTKSLNDPSVIELQGLLSRNVGLVPFTTLSRLKEGWTPHKLRWGATLQTLVMVAVSVVTILVTVELTFLHERGVATTAELREIVAAEPSLRYRELIREVVEARAHVDAIEGGASAGDDLGLAHEAYLAREAELKLLSDRIKVGFEDATVFLTHESRFPVWGMTLAYCLYQNWIRPDEGVAASEVGFWGRRHDADSYAVFCERPDELGTTPPTSEAPERVVLVQAQAPPPATRSNFEDDQQRMDAAVQDLLGRQVIQFAPEGMPPIALLATRMSDRLAPFALWVLPGLYGALGAIFYHLRLILDPLRPNPPNARLAHRIALGATAGIVLTWFFTPNTPLGQEADDIGLTTFALAFLFGFSLEAFFATIDRFVLLSDGGGGRPPGGAPVTGPTPQGATGGSPGPAAPAPAGAARTVPPPDPAI